jgi:hypothetical protein
MNGDNVYLSVQKMFFVVVVKSNLKKRICLHAVHVM